MMDANKALWNSVCRTDPAHVKPITGKQYNGNSPKPYYIVERLTDTFGPCGIGWGFTVLSERMERLTETDVLHVALLRFWYVLDGKRGEFDQMGQTKAVYEKSKGGFMVDEDAPKKSVTDALVKCASYLGFAGDIFSGRWDDSKYVAELKQDFARKPEPQKVVITATDGADELLDEDARDRMDEVALMMVEHHRAGNTDLAADIWYADDTFSRREEGGNEERVYLWSRLKAESKLRSAINADPRSPRNQDRRAA